VLVIIVLVGRDRISAFTGGIRGLAAELMRRLILRRSSAVAPPGGGS
jgi:hypothetical protein